MASDSTTVAILPGNRRGINSYHALDSEDTAAPMNVGAVTFHDVKYSVSSFPTRKVKSILNGVSGYMPQGLNAIMGPTGSGKTSLLDILAGRKATKGLSGAVLVNGERQPRNFKCVAGYVVQDDIIMGTLTVRENLNFSAVLRLPSRTTREERKERVERVIKELGLQNCANTKIGTEFIRGVSGGERKRTNIGMELIIEPKVLFLDEPTTGLDSNTAVSVVQKLKILSEERQCIIIMSIHQPRYSIFEMFDTLTLLSHGSMVYHGKASEALEYFKQTLGHQCKEHENPADFFLDVIIQCEKASIYNEPYRQLGDKESSVVVSKKDLEESYKQSDQYQANQRKLSDIMAHERKSGRVASRPMSYATNVFWQLMIVSLRSMKNLVRTPTTFLTQTIIMTVLAIMAGVLYLRLDTKEYNPHTVINNRLGAIFFIIINQVFTNIPAIDVFIKQRALFIHENVSGFYRVSAFFVAKLFTDILPMRLIPLLLYSVITYFMIGFQRDVAKFFIYFLTLALTSVAAASVAFAISARISVTAVAIIQMAMFMILSILFGGFLVSLNSLSWVIRWLKYISIFRYAIEALSINELVGQCYFAATENQTSGSCYDYGISCELPLCVNGTQDVMNRGYETSSNWLWYDMIGLAGLILIFLFLSYINLRTIKKLK